MPSIEAVSADTTLRIGLQLEKLVCAIDGEDLVSIEELAERFQAIAEGDGLDDMAQLAANLCQRVDEAAPWSEVLQLCSELVELSRRITHAHTMSAPAAAPSPTSMIGSRLKPAKNCCRLTPRTLGHSTFEQGHKEVVFCEAILASHRQQSWVKVREE